MPKYQCVCTAGSTVKKAQLQAADSPVLSTEGTSHIGVMCIDLAQPLEQKFVGGDHSYLPTSYVKQL